VLKEAEAEVGGTLTSAKDNSKMTPRQIRNYWFLM